MSGAISLHSIVFAVRPLALPEASLHFKTAAARQTNHAAVSNDVMVKAGRIVWISGFNSFDSFNLFHNERMTQYTGLRPFLFHYSISRNSSNDVLHIMIV